MSRSARARSSGAFAGPRPTATSARTTRAGRCSPATSRSCCSPGSAISGTCPGAARIRLTFSSRGCPDGPTGSPGSITGTRWPRNSGSRTTAQSSSAHGARQYLVIERYDRVVRGETVTLVHQEDAAQALGLDWVDDHAKFQNPEAPRDSRRPSAYRIAELLGSLQGHGGRSPTSCAGSRSLCSSATTTPMRRTSPSCTFPAAASSRTSTTQSRTSSRMAGSTTASPSPSTAASTIGASAPRTLSAKGSGGMLSAPARQSGSSAATLADFATALDHVPVPQGVPAVAVAQLAWNLERLQSGEEIGERPSGYRRRPNRSRPQREAPGASAALNLSTVDDV